jgi:hypothetical protein
MPQSRLDRSMTQEMLQQALGDLRPFPSHPQPIESGNIDLAAQPSIPNPLEGGMSTVYSVGVNLDGKEVLLPSVTPDGRFLKTVKEVVDEYRKTGRHLGKFKTSEDSDLYGQQLHQQYERGNWTRK